MKQTINEIGNTPQGMYALGQVAGRAYDRMFNGTKNSVGDGIVALNPKYGKVAQDAAYAAAGGYMDWRKKFKEQNGREPSDDEYRAWMQNYKNGSNDYGKPESERKGVVKISESQLRNMIAESVKRVLYENHGNIYDELNSLLYEAMGDALYCGKGWDGWDFYECYDKRGKELLSILKKYNWM